MIDFMPMNYQPEQQQQQQQQRLMETNGDVASSNARPQESVADFEAALAREMTQLTMDERVKALEDIHGVSSVIEEDPAFLQQKLIELDQEISNQKNYAYRIAESLDHHKQAHYVQNTDFRLMFLRADLFDATAAAQRLMSFLEFKLSLFGQDKLCRDIRLDDLSAADLESLETGTVQHLSKKDRAGRPVLVVFQQLRRFQSQENQLRAFFYILMTLVTGQPDAQRRGVVTVFYNTSGSPVQPLPSLAWRSLKLRQTTPVRNATAHACLSSDSSKSSIGVLLNMWYRVNRSYGRVRLRKHVGTDQEVRFKLQSFGFPIDCFPVTEDGDIDPGYHQKWLQKRRELEGVVGSNTITNNGWPTSSISWTNSSVVDLPQDQTNFLDLNNPFEVTPIASPSIGNAPLPVLSQLTTPCDTPPFQEPIDVLSNSNLIPSSVGSGITPQQEPKSGAHTPPPMMQLTPNQGWNFGPVAPPVQQEPNNAAQQMPSFFGSNRRSHQQLPSSPQPNMPGYITPKSQDVLFGRGKPIRNHPGNVRFRNLMEQHADDYGMAPKFVKSMITEKLVKMVLASGSRFLKPVGDQYWVVVDQKAAQGKVGQYFRSKRANK